MGRLTGNRLTLRDNAVAQDRMTGMTYYQLAEKYGLSKTYIGEILKKDNIKEVIETGSRHMVSLIPKAIDIQIKAMDCKDKDGNPSMLALKASENVLKTSAVMPSNVTNQTINNTFNQQNNLITAQTMDLVKKILPGFKGEPKGINPDAA